MPLIDMPLDELRRYQGTNPKPADFDAYWESGLAEMRAVDPQLEIVPASNPAKFARCFDLWFTGVRGGRIHCKLLRPVESKAPCPAVVMFHGYSMSAGDWLDKLPYAAQGFVVAAMDVRGQGGLSYDPGGAKGNTLNGHIIRGLDDEPDRLFYRHVFLDCAQLAGIVMAMPDVDVDRVGATGWSQGGGLTLACAALEPRIRRAAPIYPFLCDYRRVWEMDLARAAYDELQTYFRRFDPTHANEDAAFEKLGYVDVQHLAPRIQAEVMFGTGLMDNVCPPSTQFAAYNKITSRKSMVLYPDFTHEGLPEMADRIFEFMCGL